MIQASTSQKYLLYADDDADDQEIMSEMIAGVDASMEVVGLSDGREVLEFLRSLPEKAAYPCLIILDLNMPQLDGLQTLRKLKSDPELKNIAVVMFSTSDQRRDKDESLNFGAEDFITKPVRTEELARVTSKFNDYCHGAPLRIRH